MVNTQYAYSILGIINNYQEVYNSKPETNQ